jgi:cell wall-associated NlpC family hydrolase
MPPPLRSLVPAFAPFAIVVGCAASTPSALPEVLHRGSAPSASVIDEATLYRPPLRRLARTPTLGARAATIALKAVGVPYRWGGASPASGFDCSGLVHWTYRRLGIELPHSSYALYERGRRVPRSRMKPGDVLFFYGLGHVGVYLGRGRMVHAPESGRSVEVVELERSYYGRGLVAARRLVRS